MIGVPEVHTPSKDEDASFLPLYAMFLLAQFRDRRAYPLIMEICKLPRESLDVLIGDTVTEGLPQIIASVFDGDTVLASEAVDLYAKTLVDDIRGAYEEGLLWPGYMAPQEVDQVFGMQEQAVLARSKKRNKGLIDDLVEEMHWWACFNPRRDSRPKLAESFRAPAGRQDADTAVRSHAKFGRNAPCPCGSGKKYKRCCGR